MSDTEPSTGTAPDPNIRVLAWRHHRTLRAHLIDHGHGLISTDTTITTSTTSFMAAPDPDIRVLAGRHHRTLRAHLIDHGHGLTTTARRARRARRRSSRG